MAESTLVGTPPAEIEAIFALEDEHWWYGALHRLVLTALRPAGPVLDLLDAGCGGGGMLARVRECFPAATLTGLDTSSRALELTRARDTGVTLVRGSVDALPFGDASFDAVLSLDVLDVAGVDVRAALRELRRIVRADGRVILNLPAFDAFRGSHNLAVNSVHRFTRPRLEQLLVPAGLRIERATYWNTCLAPAIAAARWASRHRRRGEARSDLRPVSPPINRAFALLLRAELAVGRRAGLPFGTSLFAVARP
jgi:SAM-dependent methyltransferase